MTIPGTRIDVTAILAALSRRKVMTALGGFFLAVALRTDEPTLDAVALLADKMGGALPLALLCLGVSLADSVKRVEPKP